VTPTTSSEKGPGTGVGHDGDQCKDQLQLFFSCKPASTEGAPGPTPVGGLTPVQEPPEEDEGHGEGLRQVSRVLVYE
jgi:hypothetical protein